ncbi:hypothetical protein R1flu_005435 [Riccia fluitans]|uniref:Uncharacterized protein n=1 Tax=Riccia fluitans TaxID=41844 RepID=A0ABD1YT65_9MARC
MLQVSELSRFEAAPSCAQVLSVGLLFPECDPSAAGAAHRQVRIENCRIESQTDLSRSRSRGRVLGDPSFPHLGKLRGSDPPCGATMPPSVSDPSLDARQQNQRNP